MKHAISIFIERCKWQGLFCEERKKEITHNNFNIGIAERRSYYYSTLTTLNFMFNCVKQQQNGSELWKK